MSSIRHHGSLTVLVLTGVALGGCAGATDVDPDGPRDSTRVVSLAVERYDRAGDQDPRAAGEPDLEPGANGEAAGAADGDVGEPGYAGDPSYVGDGAPGYGGDPSYVGDGAPGYGVDPSYGGGGGYVGAPGYTVGGCDAFGNCYQRSEWATGGIGGAAYGRSTSYSYRSGSACDAFGCTFY